jgi:hypothetical protein
VTVIWNALLPRRSSDMAASTLLLRIAPWLLRFGIGMFGSPKRRAIEQPRARD